MTIVVPSRWFDETEHRVKLSDAINAALKGKLNNTGTVTLTANTTTTVITDTRIGVDSFIGFMPTTANASAEIGNGTMYVSSRGDKTATVTHANNAQTDRSFTYCVLG
jgi:hypothetical protein